MNPNELHQLWQDALDELPHPAATDAPPEPELRALRARRRRTWTARDLVLTAAALAIAACCWEFSQSRGQVAVKQEPTPLQPPAPTQQIALEEPKRPMIESVSLKDFLAQLPHHGYMTIENERGRFLVMVDHKTGETTTTRLSKDDQL
jgi:hypothetical protein